MARTRYYGGFMLPPNLRFKPSGAAKKAAPPPAPPRPPVVFPEGLVSFSSGVERCGVNEYSVGLARHMRLSGAEVAEVKLSETEVLAAAPAGARVLLHVEPSLLPPGFGSAVSAARRRGAKVVACFHHFDVGLLHAFADSVDLLVLHRDYGVKHPKIRTVPLACPVHELSDRAALRAKFKFDQRPVVTTFGFLSQWKRFPEVAERLLPEIERRGAVLQMICPVHSSGDKAGEGQKLERVLRGKASATWIRDFLPESEVLERVEASDLGAMYHGMNTGSCSAANKVFVSARCPLLVTSSNHDADVRGAERTDSLDLGVFVKRAGELLRDLPRLRQRLKAGMEADYLRMNQAAVAEQYLALFEEIRR